MIPPQDLLDLAVAHGDLQGTFETPAEPTSFTLAPRHLQPLDDADEDFALGAAESDDFESPVFVFAADADCPTPDGCGRTGCTGRCQPPAA